MEYIDTIAQMLRHYDVPTPLRAHVGEVVWETTSFITHVAYLDGGEVSIDKQAIEVSGF